MNRVKNEYTMEELEELQNTPPYLKSEGMSEVVAADWDDYNITELENDHEMARNTG